MAEEVRSFSEVKATLIKRPSGDSQQTQDATKKVDVKAAYIDGKIVDAAQVHALAALPPKIELLARLVGSLKSPLYGLVMVLSGNQSGLVRVLNSIREQKSANQPATAQES